MSPSAEDASLYEDLSDFVAKSSTESPAPRSPDLAANPIMDMEQEEDASHSVEQEDDDSKQEDDDSEQEDDDLEQEDDDPNLSLPTHASFVSASPTLSTEYEVDDPDESLPPPVPIKASKNKGKGRVVEDSEDELDLIDSPAKQGGKKALRETPDVTSIREKLQGVSLEAPKRVTRSRLKK